MLAPPLFSLPSSLTLGGTLPSKLDKPTTYCFPHTRLSTFFPSLSLSLSFFFLRSTLFLYSLDAQTRNKVAVNRPGSGRFAPRCSFQEARRHEGARGWKRGGARKIKTREARLDRRSRSHCRCFSSLANCSLRVSVSCKSVAVFSPISRLPSLRRPSLFPAPPFLAGVINDLTDTLDERCHESVKQVVIKADAVSL